MEYSIEFVEFSIDFVEFSIEFVDFSSNLWNFLEFVEFSMEFYGIFRSPYLDLQLDFQAHDDQRAIRIGIVEFSIEFVEFSIEFVEFCIEFCVNIYIYNYGRLNNRHNTIWSKMFSK